MVNFENAVRDGNETLAEATLAKLRNKVRDYAAAHPGTPEEIAARLEAPELRRNANGEMEQWPGLFDQMVIGLPYALNTITAADVAEALNG